MQGDTTRRDAGPPLPLPRETVEEDRVLPLPGGGPLDATAPCAPPGPAPPRTLGGYALEGELGRGGMGVVHRARSLALGRVVALKTLRLGPGDQEEALRFQTEARAAASLRHPNVVAVHEVGRDGDTLFLAMDLVEGQSLRARVLREGRLEPREAARVALGVARALEHAHARGVLHRDVKPHNVLLGADGAPLLADFGLARQVDAPGARVTRTGQVLGTPAYMAPELAQGDARGADARADVYGLGATLYELLTGAPPFTGASAVEVLRAVVEDEPEPPRRRRPRLDRDLETICLRCLAKAPADRYPDAAALAADLERYAREEPILARPPGPLERLARWARRRKGAALGLGLLLAAAAAGVVGARAHERRASLEALAAEWSALAAVATRQAPAARLARAERAFDVAARWVAAAPDDPAARAARRAAAEGLGDACRLRQDWSRAAQAYRDAGAAEGAAWCDDLEVARGLLSQGATARACVVLRRATTRPVPWPEAWRLLGAWRAIRGDVGGLEDLDRACALAPDDLESRLARAQARATWADWAGARVDVERALTLDPDHAEALAQRSQLSPGSDQARVDAERAVTLDPESPVAWTALAEALSSRDAAGARAAVERALALAPDDAGPWVLRAELALQDRDFAAAERDAARACRLRPALPRGWRAYGLALARRGELTGAIHALRYAATLGGHDRVNWQGLADALVEAGRLDAAREALDQGLALLPHDGVLHADRATVRVLLRDLDGALGDAEAAVAREPGSGRCWLTLAAVRRARGEPDAAREAVDRALVVEPALPEAWWVRAQARSAAGDRAGAAADIARALELAPVNHPQVGRMRELRAALRAD